MVCLSKKTHSNVPKLSEEDLRQLAEDKKKNFQDRLEFIRKYADRIKTQPDGVWSVAQAKFLDSQ